MEKIEHTTIPTNGINLHVASIGSGPTILFLHGFPELCPFGLPVFSLLLSIFYFHSIKFNNQLLSLSALGYRAIAPDLRGFGDSDAPPSPESYTSFHIVGDLIGVLDHLGIDQVFLVGHDWGAVIAWHFCLFRPDRVKALVNMSIAFRPRNPTRKPTESFRAMFGDDYYICRFQKPGEAEEYFAGDETASILKKFYVARNPKPPCIPKEVGFRCLKTPEALPSWLSEEDVNYFAEKFNQKGFTGGLNYYRALDLTWELTAPWTGVQIKVPVMFIIGDLDITYHIPGTKEYIHNGGFKKDVPYLQEVIVMEGVAHFINQEKAEEVSAHIYDFIKKF
ncbi:hypothetical protein UlMin_031171 [Ulmus minor]